MPSPGTFDPMLEHFLRPLEPAAGLCSCALERTGGKTFRMMLEEGNVSCGILPPPPSLP